MARLRIALPVLTVAVALGLTAPGSAAPDNSPDPGGLEGAIVKIPPPGGDRFFGVHDEKILNGPPEHAARVAAGVGAKIFRFTINWTRLEPVRDQWDDAQWGRYRAVYRALLDNGIQPLITISGAPLWSRDLEPLPLLCNNGRGCEFPPRPAMHGEWAEFAGAVAQRFPRTAAIEIWNEPNHWGFWKTAPQPARYAGLVVAASKAIKAESSDIKVLGGALSAADKTNRDPLGVNVTMSMREFLTRAYTAKPSIAGHIDGISFHQVSQAINYGPGSQMAKAFRDARSVRRKYEKRRIPLWLTEFSLSTSDGPRVTPKVQAERLLAAYRKVMTIRDVGGFLVHTLRDRVELGRSHRDYGIGLVETVHPFVPKPSYCAFAGRLRSSPLLGSCRKIRESRVSRCTRSLTDLARRKKAAKGSRRGKLRRRHARKSARCVPCVRKETALERTLRRKPNSTNRAALRDTQRRCTPCEGRLGSLQKRYLRVMPTLKLHTLNRHEAVRRRCR